MALASTLGPQALNIFVQTQIPGASLQGLVNGQYYALLANGSLSGTIVNPVTTTTAAQLLAAGISEGNGMYFVPPQAKSLVVHLVSNGAQTGLSSGGLVLFPVIYPLLATTPPVCSAIGGTITFGPASQSCTIVPISNATSSVTTISSSAGLAGARVFIPAIGAATWPTTGTRLDIQIEWE